MDFTAVQFSKMEPHVNRCESCNNTEMNSFNFLTCLCGHYFCEICNCEIEQGAYFAAGLCSTCFFKDCQDEDK